LVYPIKQSAYELKNNCCLFVRLFKIEKNGIFLFVKSIFVVFEILMFCTIQIMNMMTSFISWATKTVKNNKEYLWKYWSCSSNLASEMYIANKKK